MARITSYNVCYTKLLRIDDLYQSYLEDPESVDISWQQFFAGFELARASYPEKPSAVKLDNIDKEFAILNLIHGSYNFV